MGLTSKLSGKPRRVITASAVKLSRAQYTRIRTVDWQRQAWTYYDSVPELRYVTNWMAQACSQMRLYVGRVDPDGSADPEPVDDPHLVAPLRALYGGYTQHPEMLRRMATHLGLIGETYLVTAKKPDGSRLWHVASGDEFIRRSGEISLRIDATGENVPLPDEDGTAIIRVWISHPRRAWEADAATRPLITVCAEIVGLSGHINATIESRMAGNGLLLLRDDAYSANFVDDLTENMVTPIQDRDSAASVVPMVATTGAEKASEAAAFIRFDTQLSDKVQEMRQAAIERLAGGADAPREVVLGIAAINHWNVSQITEDQQRFHIEPLMTVIASALTKLYYRPLLSDRDATQYAIWFDAARLTTPSDKTEDARAFYELGLLSGSAALRSGGWSEDDMPDAAEAADMLLTQLARSGVDPATVAPYLQALGVNRRTVDAETVTPTDEPDSTPAAKGSVPARMPRAITAASGESPHRSPVDAARFALCHAATLRALEICGKRMLTGSTREMRRKLRDIPGWSLYRSLPRPEPDDMARICTGAFDLADELLPGDTAARAAVRTHVEWCLASGDEYRDELLRTRLVGATAQEARHART